MRDPDGILSFKNGYAVRKVDTGADAIDFLRSSFASSLALDGKLVPYEFSGTAEITSPEYPFVSYPFEWSDAQLCAAARFTLRLSREILQEGFELKDASAWNIVFAGVQPMLCDHLSFRRIARRQWWAFGQYVRHFILPLAVSQLTGLKGYHAFLLNRDGLHPATARSLLGFRRFLSRYWPLTLELSKGGYLSVDTAKTGTPTYHDAIYRYCEFNIPRRVRGRRSSWSLYKRDRAHYSDVALGAKRSITARWIAALRPGWVVDLGCNTGEFSLMAAEQGASCVVAIDFDHDSVQELYLCRPASRAIHPVIANLGDLSGGRGWLARETRSLVDRLKSRADVVVCLALIHHLAISESVPLSDIASLLWNLTKAHAIVEFVDHSDPLLAVLATQRSREADEFSIAQQKQAFHRYFEFVAVDPIPMTRREIALLRRRGVPLN